MNANYRLNVGCFNNPIDGWVNIDMTFHAVIARLPLLRDVFHRLKMLSPQRYKEHVSGKFRNIVRHDIRKRLPFPDESCLFIYSSHVIEHLFYTEVEHYFRECHRVLAKGGVVRTVVPCFSSYAERYLTFRKERIGDRKVHELLNSRNVLDELDSFLQSFFEETYARDRSNFLKHGHKSLWDEIILAHVLYRTGFSDIELCEFQRGKLPDLEKLETRKKGSIYVEASK